MVYKSFLRTIVFFSFIFCIGRLYSADHKKKDLIDQSLKNLVLSLGARYIDDPATLFSLSRVNKDTHVLMYALHQERSNELKNYIKDKQDVIDPAKVAYTPNNVRAYYVGKGKANVGNPALITLSHYGNECKKEVKKYFINSSFGKAELLKKYKPFVHGDACYMYDTHTEQEGRAGTFVRVLHTGGVELVHAYCNFKDQYVPSGWLAGFLPKLYAELIYNGDHAYYPWNKCRGVKLKKIDKSLNDMRHADELTESCTGLLLFNGDSLKSISSKDKDMLYWMIPEVRDSVDADGLVGVCPSSSGSATCLFTVASLMHMHMSWGEQDTVANFLGRRKPIYYRIKKYGTFTMHPFTEEITFKPHASLLKKIKKGFQLRRVNKQVVYSTLQKGDTHCNYALKHLKQHGAFVVKDWLAKGKNLSCKLSILHDLRYTISHNSAYVLIHDAVRLGLYVITLAQGLMPTLQFLPNIKKSQYILTDEGYNVEYEPDPTHD